MKRFVHGFVSRCVALNDADRHKETRHMTYILALCADSLN